MRNSLFQQVIIEIGSLPKTALAWAALSAVVGEILEVTMRHDGRSFSRLDAVGVAVDLPVYLFAGYAIVTLMIGHRPSLRGAAAFAITTIVTIGVPPALLLAGLWALPRDGGSLPLLAVLIAGLSVFAVLMPLLAAWPVAEAVSTHFVGPWRILRATRGCRWDLIWLAYLTAGLGKLAPALSKAHDANHVLLFASGHAVIDGAALIVASGIAVSAWKFARRNDPGLVGMATAAA